MAAEDLVKDMQPLGPGDSPLNHALFHAKLCHVAAAIALQPAWPAMSGERTRIDKILSAAGEYFEQTLPRYVTSLRGVAPASGLQADFEADVVYAAELWDVYTNGRYWPRLAAAMNGACDLYFWTEWN